VLVMPTPVTTVYVNPHERVMFWPQRDANPFLHLYESLWMLAGRNDIAPLIRYAKQFENYSDDGSTLHGAYGHRWREHFGFDQLEIIVKRLRANVDDRRSVLQMWDCNADLSETDIRKDLPCNTIVSFQVSPALELDMTVFCRSNDIVWGAYGANAVHFSFLQEFLALCTGLHIGRYYQVSVNWHGYLSTLKPVADLQHEVGYECPYEAGQVIPMLMAPYATDGVKISYELRDQIPYLLRMVDAGCQHELPIGFLPSMHLFYGVLKTHAIYKAGTGPEKFSDALTYLEHFDGRFDWVQAAFQWLMRRLHNYQRGNQNQS